MLAFLLGRHYTMQMGEQNVDRTVPHAVNSSANPIRETVSGKRGGRQCSACQHPQHRELDARLAAGEPVAFLARGFGLSDDALRRHRDHHLSEAPTARRAAEPGEVRVKVTIPEDADPIEELERLSKLTHGLLAKAWREGDLRLVRAVLAEARAQIELRAKLSGKLDEQPVVAVVDRDAIIARLDARLARLAPPGRTIDGEVA